MDPVSEKYHLQENKQTNKQKTKLFIFNFFISAEEQGEQPAAQPAEGGAEGDDFSQLLDGVPIEDFAAFDDEEQTSPTEEQALAPMLDDGDDPEEKEAGEPSEPPINCYKAVQNCNELTKYALANGMGEDVVEYMMRLADDIQRQRTRKRTIESKQSDLMTYFKQD